MPETRTGTTGASGQVASSRRPHLYEVDLLRVLTALAVVGVHSVSLSIPLNTSLVGAEKQDAVVALLHFTREIFLSITALVLIYGYANQTFSTSVFWRKRGLGVLVPYLIWSGLYSWQHHAHAPVSDFLGATALDALTGSASYQLYFILLSLEVYLVLPLLLRLAGPFARHPWLTLASSFALQLVLLWVDFTRVQAGPFATSSLGDYVNNYQSRFLPLYQLYVVLGMVAALHLARLRDWVRAHGWWVVIVMVIGTGVYLGYYAYAVGIENLDLDYETSVFQPSMVLYATASALFLYWLCVRWADTRGASGKPVAQPLVGLLSDASFGIYLVHPMLLDMILGQPVPAMPDAWPLAARVALIWLLTATGSFTVIITLLHVTALSRLVGRSSLPSPMSRWVNSRLAGRRLEGREHGSGNAGVPQVVRVPVVATRVQRWVREDGREWDERHALRTGDRG